MYNIKLIQYIEMTYQYPTIFININFSQTMWEFEDPDDFSILNYSVDSTSNSDKKK